MKSFTTKRPLCRKHQSNIGNALYHQVMGKGKIQGKNGDVLKWTAKFSRWRQGTYLDEIRKLNFEHQKRHEKFRS